MSTNGPFDEDGVGDHPEPETLGDLDDGLLEPAAAAQVREHLLDCPDCSDLATGMAEVGRVLAADPLPELPAGVAARLDAALADVCAARLTAGHAAATPTARAGPTARADPSAPAGSTVVPLGAGTARRRSAVSDLRTRRQVRSENRSHRRARTLVRVLGAAAALLVVGGTATVVSQQLGSGSDTDDMVAGSADSGGEEAAEAPAPSAMDAQEPPVLVSGTDYQRDTLTEQARSLIVRAQQGDVAGLSADADSDSDAGSDSDPDSDSDQGSDSESESPQSLESDDRAGASDVPTAGDAGGLLGTSEGLAGCLQELGVPEGVLPVVVDIAMFEGREAALLAVPSRGGDDYEVWVVARDCRPGADGLLSFTPVPRP